MSEHCLFPKFEQFANETNLLSKVKGGLSAKLPRILGQGKSRTVGIDLPPAPIERKLELVNTRFPESITIPPQVKDEIEQVRNDLEAELTEFTSVEGRRRLCSKVIMELSDPKGIKNDYFYSNNLLLIPDKKHQSWAWSITEHHPVIQKIPPDREYLVKTHGAALRIIEELKMGVAEFEERLMLAWKIARHFSSKEEVLIDDVARVFTIAAQESRFWNHPLKKNFVDTPPALFIINFLNWKQNKSINGSYSFELVPAALNQAYDKNIKMFYLPTDREGTRTRPYISLRMNPISQEDQNGDPYRPD